MMITGERRSISLSETTPPTSEYWDEIFVEYGTTPMV